jgi:hypothetical protein
MLNNVLDAARTLTGNPRWKPVAWFEESLRRQVAAELKISEREVNAAMTKCGDKS